MDYWTFGTFPRGPVPSLRQIFLKKLLQRETIDLPTMRDVLYHMASESKHFRPTWTKGIFKLLFGREDEQEGGRIERTILDPSAGWGDRLTSCIAENYRYLSTDPDTELETGHGQIIETFGDSENQKILYFPFEDIPVESLKEFSGERGYDAVLTSPPFGNLEIYPGSDEYQSSSRYTEHSDWMVRFLFNILTRCWKVIRPNGFLVIHMGDVEDRPDAPGVLICEAMNLFIEDYLIGSSYEGIIGVSGKEGTARPVWVWQKLTPKTRKLWNTKIQRSLAIQYPELVANEHFNFKLVPQPTTKKIVK